MLLLGLLGFKECEEVHDKARHFRCRAEDGRSYKFVHDGEKVKQICFYNHISSAGSMEIRLAASGEVVKTVGPGEAFSVFKAGEYAVTGKSGHADLTVWQTDYNKDGAYLVSDVAGLILTASSVYIPNRFPLFMDFGEKARFNPTRQGHPRSTGVEVTWYDSETDTVWEETIQDNRTRSTDSPFILHLSSCPYSPASFDFTFGSQVRLPSEFGNNLKAVKVDWIDKKGANVSNHDEIQVNLAFKREQKVWTVLGYVMVGVTALSFAAGATLCVVAIVMYSRRKRGAVFH